MDARIENLRIATLQILTDDAIVEAVHALAHALVDKKALKGDEALAIIKGTLASSSPGGKFEILCPHCAGYEEYEER
ncbi:MAG TPA: hypothetical protein DET40_04715 [Lentisphaeria bacterium]|nr:MAG: hypothetical protein A2X45_21410 [Lentisphaerae bacterium GWF2_50_93]HCE42827.1 hypothetical protein [Lentisphaeria bacterium]